MNRMRFFGLLAAAGATSLAAVPVFAEDGAKEKGVEKALTASDKRSEAAKQKLQELAQRVKERVGQGEIKSIDAGAKTFVLTSRQGDVTVTTDANTTYHQGRAQNLGFGDLKVGQRVVVQVDKPDKPAATGTPSATVTPGATATAVPTRILARRIVILPEPKPRQQRTVTVGSTSNVSIAANGTGSFSVTPVTPAGAPAVSFVVDADTVYTLKGVSAFANGQRVRVVSVKNDAGQNLAKQVRVPAGD
jgi:hypothetical protein